MNSRIACTGALLAEPVDAADALLEPQRVPRQLDIDHQPAAVMQVQAFAGGVGGDEHIDLAVIERIDRERAQLGACRR